MDFKFVWLLPVAVVAACSGPTERQFVQADATQIRVRTQEFEAAFNAKDPAKVAAFHPGESVLMPPNAPTIRGREDIQKFYVDLYAQGATDLEMETKDVRGTGCSRTRPAPTRSIEGPRPGMRCVTAASTC